jgi:hypothetical protein
MDSLNCMSIKMIENELLSIVTIVESGSYEMLSSEGSIDPDQSFCNDQVFISGLSALILDVMLVRAFTLMVLKQ